MQMSVDRQSEIADEEEFHSSFRLFFEALQMLSSSAEEQCSLMGNYNVAWELKDDVAAGRFLLNRGYLSEQQESWVRALAFALSAVDAQILPAGPGIESNLAAMRSAAWEPLRFLAQEVTRQLTPFANENATYLGLKA
jgi:hypothetical protein